MSEEKVYKVPIDVAKRAFIDAEKYQEIYARSINESDIFSLCGFALMSKK